MTVCLSISDQFLNLIYGQMNIGSWMDIGSDGHLSWMDIGQTMGWIDIEMDGYFVRWTFGLIWTLGPIKQVYQSCKYASQASLPDCQVDI